MPIISSPWCCSADGKLKNQYEYGWLWWGFSDRGICPACWRIVYDSAWPGYAELNQLRFKRGTLFTFNLAIRENCRSRTTCIHLTHTLSTLMHTHRHTCTFLLVLTSMAFRFGICWSLERVCSLFLFFCLSIFNGDMLMVDLCGGENVQLFWRICNDHSATLHSLCTDCETIA